MAKEMMKHHPMVEWETMAKKAFRKV